METSELGRVFESGEYIFRQGEPGDCMYAIQEGEAEILVSQGGGAPVRLAVRKAGDFVGEMAIFEKETRLADVRALTRLRAIRVDRKNFLKRIHEDPSLAFRLVQQLSGRVRELSHEIARLRAPGGA